MYIFLYNSRVVIPGILQVKQKPQNKFLGIVIALQTPSLSTNQQHLNTEGTGAFSLFLCSVFCLYLAK